MWKLAFLTSAEGVKSLGYYLSIKAFVTKIASLLPLCTGDSAQSFSDCHVTLHLRVKVSVRLQCFVIIFTNQFCFSVQHSFKYNKSTRVIFLSLSLFFYLAGLKVYYLIVSGNSSFALMHHVCVNQNYQLLNAISAYAWE